MFGDGPFVLYSSMAFGKLNHSLSRIDLSARCRLCGLRDRGGDCGKKNDSVQARMFGTLMLHHDQAVASAQRAGVQGGLHCPW